MAKQTQKKTVGYFKVTAHRQENGEFFPSLWVQLPNGGSINIREKADGQAEVTTYAVDRVTLSHSATTEVKVLPPF